MFNMVLSFANSFVRSSSTETNATANGNVPSATIDSRPPWVKAVENPDVLPRHLYPILPPAQPYDARVQPYDARGQPIIMSRYSSSATMTAETVMSDAQLYEDEDE
ncbi:hypothetical protein FS837_000328, partial [Tulasnella sp. UAMH 9824]